MKKLLPFLFVLCSLTASSQSICVSVDCKDTIKYPQDTVTLNGLVTSGEGVLSTLWSIKTGIATIDNVNAQVTVARGLAKGGSKLFVFQLAGTSNKGATGVAFDSVVYVPNKPPTAITGPAVTTTTTSATLSGSGSTDPEGLPLTYLWSQVSGPNTAVISTNTMANPVVSGLIGGTYSFLLTVKDSGGLTSTATQSVSMNVVQVKTVIVTTKYYSDGTTTTTTVTTIP